MSKEDLRREFEKHPEKFGVRYQNILYQCIQCKGLFFIRQKQVYNPTNELWQNYGQCISIKCPMKYQGCQGYASRVNLYDPEKGDWIDEF